MESRLLLYLEGMATLFSCLADPTLIAARVTRQA